MEQDKRICKQFHFRRYERWNEEVYLALAEFIEQYSRLPDELLANSDTLRRISARMSAEMVSKGKLNDFAQIGVFGCDLGDVVIVADDRLGEDQFSLVASKTVFDEQARVERTDKFSLNPRLGQS